MIEFTHGWFAHYGYLGLFFGLMLEIIALPIPGETMLTFTGYLIYKGQMSLVPALFCSMAGSICGITISYSLGRILGYRVLHKYGPRVRLTEDRLATAHSWFERIGKWALTLGYFLPGVRHLVGLVAGASELESHKFAAFAYPGSLLWTASFIALGYYLGDGWKRAAGAMHHRLLLGSLLVGGIVAVYLSCILIQHLRHRSHRICQPFSSERDS